MVRYLYLQEETQTSAGFFAYSGGQYIDIISESFALDNQNTAIQTAGYKYAKCEVPGPLKITGGWQQYLAADNIMRVLKYSLGTVVHSSDTDPYYHGFWPTEQDLPYFTVVVGKDGFAEAYGGCKVNALSIEGVVKEPARVTVGVDAITTNITSAATTITYPSECPFSMAECRIEFDDNLVSYVKAIRVNLAQTLNIDDSYTIAGISGMERFATSIPEGIRAVNGTLDMKFDDQTELKRFYGNVASNNPISTLTPVKIAALFNRYSGDTDLMHLTMPQVYYNTYKANINLRDLIVQNVDFTATYSTTASGELWALVANSTSGGC